MRNTRNGHPFERITEGVPAIMTDHENIHEKLAFSAVNKFTLAAAAIGYFELITPATKYVHLKPPSAQSDGPKVLIQFYEAPTLTTGVTSVVAQNRNRVGTPPTATMVLKNNPTTVSGGALLDQTYLGGGTGVGATASIGTSSNSDNEWVLKPAMTYAFKITNSGSGSADVNLDLFWYEEAAG